MRLHMIEDRVSEAELPQLHKTTDVPDGLLLELGAESGDFEAARSAITHDHTMYWDEEEEFLRSLRQETQESWACTSYIISMFLLFFQPSLYCIREIKTPVAS